MSADRRTRLRAISREKWRRDQEAILHDAETALDRGRAEGGAEKQAEIARRLLRMKMPLASIAKATGLSDAEIKRFARRRK